MASQMGEGRTRTVVDVARYDGILLHSFQNQANQVMMFSIFPSRALPAFLGPRTMALVWALHSFEP